MSIRADIERLQVLADRQLRIAEIDRRYRLETASLAARISTALTDRDRTINFLGSAVSGGSTDRGRPIIDSASMSVTWHGSSCHLSGLILFRLMARLLRRPNQFIPAQRLMDEVWESASRSENALRIAIYRLKCRLRECQLSDLAIAIRTTNGHYGLFLNDTSDENQM